MSLLRLFTYYFFDILSIEDLDMPYPRHLPSSQLALVETNSFENFWRDVLLSKGSSKSSPQTLLEVSKETADELKVLFKIFRSLEGQSIKYYTVFFNMIVNKYKISVDILFSILPNFLSFQSDFFYSELVLSFYSITISNTEEEEKRQPPLISVEVKLGEIFDSVRSDWDSAILKNLYNRFLKWYCKTLNDSFMQTIETEKFISTIKAVDHTAGFYVLYSMYKVYIHYVPFDGYEKFLESFMRSAEPNKGNMNLISLINALTEEDFERLVVNGELGFTIGYVYKAQPDEEVFNILKRNFENFVCNLSYLQDQEVGSLSKNSDIELIKALYDSAEERQKGCSFTLDLRNSYKPECSDEDFILFLPYTYFKEFVTLFSTPGNKKFRQKAIERIFIYPRFDMIFRAVILTNDEMKYIYKRTHYKTEIAAILQMTQRMRQLEVSDGIFLNSFVDAFENDGYKMIISMDTDGNLCYKLFNLGLGHEVSSKKQIPNERENEFRSYMKRLTA